MTYNPGQHHRRSIRLKEYDYSWAGWYYVTICTKDRECVLGEIRNDTVRLSRMGAAVQIFWQNIPNHFSSVELDDFVIMPNHIHGIIILNDKPRRGKHLGGSFRRGEVTSPLPEVSLGKVIAYFKYQSTKAINEEQGTPSAKVWQRNYYDHIIRNDADLFRIRTYLRNNPLQWALDEENPANLQTTNADRGGEGREVV